MCLYQATLRRSAGNNKQAAMGLLVLLLGDLALLYTASKDIYSFLQAAIPQPMEPHVSIVPPSIYYLKKKKQPWITLSHNIRKRHW